MYKMKTETYEKALQRAHDGGYFVGTWGSDEKGNRNWSVSSLEKMSDPDGAGWYTVRWDAGARVMTCNCEAGQRGIYCKHRAIVHEWMLAKIAYTTAVQQVKDEAAATAIRHDEVRHTVADRNYWAERELRHRAHKCEDCGIANVYGDNRFCAECGKERDYKHGIA